MVFSSYEFLVFLAVVFTLTVAAPARYRNNILLLASIVFYAWWSIPYLTLFLGSMVINYSFYRWLSPISKRVFIPLIVALNLAAILYFKYWNFVVIDSGLGALFGWNGDHWNILLPLGISFFTFQQIAFQIDQWERRQEVGFQEYLLFVSFFPQLIAGPIVHHSEMMPQFEGGARFSRRMFTAGFVLFALGVAKKIIIADTIGLNVDSIFALDNPADVTTLGAWFAVVGYTVQLYFDFSGYSDMAVGLGAIFGIALPMNFYSPYKSASIIEFWRRWHMTLSRFLRDYLYIPLGGNRGSEPRRILNIFVTMVLGGIWHGSGPMFLLWGIYHGLGICFAHIWRSITKRSVAIPAGIGIAVTFLFVANGWILFRSADLQQAELMWARMYDWRAITLPEQFVNDVKTFLSTEGWGATLVKSRDYQSLWPFAFLLVGLTLTLFGPNTAQLLGRFYPGLGRDGAIPDRNIDAGRANVWLVLGAGILVGVSLTLLGRDSPFLYFQF